MSDLLRNGVFPLPATLPAECHCLDLSGSHTPSELLQRIGTALGFPEWYDANFDALFDCLIDAANIDCLALTGLEAFAVAQAEAFSTLHLVLAAVCDVRGELGKPVCFYLAGLSEGRTHAGG